MTTSHPPPVEHTRDQALVSKWLVDASSSSQVNELADELLNHLHRYLLTPEALLFDPALKRVIVQQMKKVGVAFLSVLLSPI